MNQRFHVFTDDALGDLDGVALAERLRRGEVSVAEVTDAAIARSERVHQALNAVELPLYEQARQRDQLGDGVFAGVPTYIKDNTDVQAVPTRHGSRAVKARAARATGAFARQYLSMGFQLLGKSVLPEFGFNATTEFDRDAPTRNPWNPAYSSGASSGGAAVLVATGAVPIAHANDGGGSIRIPAACCGLVGLKPTRGRLVDAEGSRALPVNIVGEGVVTRSVRDTAWFFHGAERYQPSRKFPRMGLVEGPASRRLRIGVVYDSVTGYASCPQTRATVAHTARLLESLGHDVEEIALPVPPQFADDFRFYWGMLSFLISTLGSRIISPGFDPRELDGLSKGLAASYRKQFLRTPAVLYRLKKTWHLYADMFRQRDLVLSPVLAHTTPELGYISPNVPFDELMDRLTRYVSFTPINNAAGGPAISLPMGASDNDLPIGVQFSAAHGDERSLLEIAYELEQAQPWRRIQDQRLQKDGALAHG